jgi:hypothetical protein
MLISGDRPKHDCGEKNEEMIHFGIVSVLDFYRRWPSIQFRVYLMALRVKRFVHACLSKMKENVLVSETLVLKSSSHFYLCTGRLPIIMVNMSIRAFLTMSSLEVLSCCRPCCTWLIPLVEQEKLTVPEQLVSLTVFCESSCCPHFHFLCCFTAMFILLCCSIRIVRVFLKE